MLKWKYIIIGTKGARAQHFLEAMQRKNDCDGGETCGNYEYATEHVFEIGQPYKDKDECMLKEMMLFLSDKKKIKWKLS
mgnify:CR=1 FL=1